MIVSIANSVSEKVVELNNRNQSLNINTAMQDTYKELSGLSNKISIYIDFIQSNNDRIKGDDRQRLINGLKNILDAVKSSQIRFKDERRQVQQIQFITKTVDLEFQNAKSIWHSAFRAEIEPILKAAELSAELQPPDIRKQILQLHSEILIISKDPPQNKLQSDNMISKINRLQKYSDASFVKDKPEVGEFLSKVERGTATIADLSDEIVLWIKEQNLFEKFRITFNK